MVFIWGPRFLFTREGSRQLLSPQLTLPLALFRSLIRNNLGEQTGVALGKALETNTSLKELQ